MQNLLKRGRIMAIALALTAMAVPLGAQQSSTTGTIRGRVTDAEGKPVSGAQVLVRNESTGMERGAVADDNGRYLVALLPPGGPYLVRATSIGHQTIERTGYSLGLGAALMVDMVLPIEAVVLAGIEVNADVVRIDQAQSGQRIRAAQLENIPVNGRDFTDFIKISPLMTPQTVGGTGGQFAIAGARTAGTNIQIDGADANNVFFGENRGSSRTPFSFSLESVKEFQLVTNGLDVEYSNYQGGVMNAVTKGGTNRFEGSAFYYHRDEKLTAKDFNGQEPDNFHAEQLGFNFAGPIQRDRMHFFVSMDAQLKDKPIYPGKASVTGISESSTAKYMDILKTRYGIQNPTTYYGDFEQTENNLVLFGRVDWTLTPSHHLTVRQNFSKFEQGNDRVNATEALTSGGPYRATVHSTVAELNSTIGSKAFNTLRFQWSDEDRPRPANEDGGYLPTFTVDNIDGSRRLSFGGDGIIFRNHLIEKKLQLVDNFVYRKGDHTLKLGTNNLLASTTNIFWLLGAGDFRFSSLADFEAGKPASYFRLTRACKTALTTNSVGETVVCPEYDVPAAEFESLEYSVYAQDEWQVNDRLSATFGLRYDGTRFNTDPGRVQAAEQAFGVETGSIPNLGRLSPRAAFVYDFNGNGEAVVRGGVGVLTGRFPTVLVGNVFQTERPLLSVFCAGVNVPTITMSDYLDAAKGENNPLACRSGGAPTGLPEYAFFDSEFESPRTLKANLGYERFLGAATRIKVDALFSETKSNFMARNINLGPQRFSLAGEAGRPVFVPVAANGRSVYNPTRAAGNDRLANPAFANVYLNTSEGIGRAYNLTAELSHAVADAVDLTASYALNYAYDNSSFSCCTSFEVWSGVNQGGAAPQLTTAGDPNFFGGVGDDEKGTWGPSAYDQRHVLTLAAVYRAPLGIEVSGLWRSASGTPFTPLVNGDINGDGVAGNDRAMISPNLQFKTAADKENFENLLSDNDCLADQVGSIAMRNSCRNPWWHSLDLRLAKEIPTVRSQKADLLLDLFNVLNGINSDWGQFKAVEGNSAASVLLKAEGYDTATGSVIYSTNYRADAAPGNNFGDPRPVGFKYGQFQAQVGIRYRF